MTNPPAVMLCTMLLNEEEWILKSYAQHKDWPGLRRWVFVHGADVEYGRNSPELVTADGLSTDRTGEILNRLAKQDKRVTVIHHGWMRHGDRAAGKVAGKRRFLEAAKLIKPDFLIILDQDEFYTRADQAGLGEVLRACPDYDGWTFPKREIWRPPSLAHSPLLAYEVVGGFWGIPCCHWWRWSAGMHYADCHNTPNDGKGRPLNDRLLQLHDRPDMPQMLHLGYASSPKSRAAKAAYYAARGERADPLRSWYVESRAAWAGWRPGSKLPRGAKVISYQGPVPECFREECDG